MPISEQTSSLREQLDFAGRLAGRTLGYWWLILLVAAVGSSAAYGLVCLRTELFESETVIMHRDVIPDDLVQGVTGRSSSSRYMHSRFEEMLRARPLLEPIIEEQKLFTKLIADEGMEAAIGEIRELIKLRSSGGGMFKISFRGASPEKTQAVTKRLADGLIAWELRLQLESASVARDFLAGERSRLAEELADREHEMAEFLAAHPEFAKENQLASGGTGASIRARQLDNPSVPMSAARLNPVPEWQRQRAKLEAQLNGRVVPATRSRTPEELQADEGLARALRDRDRSTQKLAELRSQFTDRHPDVATAKARVAAAQRAVRAAETVVRAAEAAAGRPEAGLNKQELRTEIARLDRQIAGYRERAASKRARARPKDDEFAGLVSLETEWSQLLRDFRATKERYAWIESKAFSADMAASSEVARQGTQLTIVNPANLPTKPAGMSRWMLLAAGALLSFGGGIGLALLLALLAEQSRAAAEEQQHEPIRSLAVIAHE